MSTGELMDIKRFVECDRAGIIILKELMDDESISEETRILYEKACVLLEIEIDSLLGG